MGTWSSPLQIPLSRHLSLVTLSKLLCLQHQASNLACRTSELPSGVHKIGIHVCVHVEPLSLTEQFFSTLDLDINLWGMKSGEALLRPRLLSSQRLLMS